MRKNIASVIDAFHSHETYQDKTCRTDGEAIWSYAQLIAVRAGSVVYALDPAESPSRTTTSQIRAVLAALPDAQTRSAGSLCLIWQDVGREDADDDRGYPVRGDREDFHADG
jgi:hypothetical protein